MKTIQQPFLYGNYVPSIMYLALQVNQYIGAVLGKLMI